MPRFIIERAIPEIGSADRAALAAAAQTANGVLAAMQAEDKQIQWEHSYVAGDKTFCVYLSADEALIAEHAERSGFPASTVTRVEGMIDPVTARDSAEARPPGPGRRRSGRAIFPSCRRRPARPGGHQSRGDLRGWARPGGRGDGIRVGRRGRISSSRREPPKSGWKASLDGLFSPGAAIVYNVSAR